LESDTRVAVEATVQATK